MEQTFNNNIVNEYDLIFLPPWEIETIKDRFDHF